MIENTDRPSFEVDASDSIRIRGARVHNLKNIDLDIPRDKLVVITGPSGSGKSSLAFDTIYAEGQRQYIESLSVYARQFLNQLERPDVDLIEGLQPTICIDQRPGGGSPRSTVSTVTEIYDYLRLMMARLGQPTCYQCGAPICQQTLEEIQQRLMEFPEGTKVMLLAPMVRGKRGAHKDVLSEIRQAGLVRARIDGEIHDVDQLPELSPRKNHHIEAVVDRVIIREGIDSRLAESLQLAIGHGEGLVIACYLESGKDASRADSWKDELFSTLYACSKCNVSLEEVEPRTFSFNSPYGACPDCDGLGHVEQFDPDLVLPSRDLSLAKGAIAPWRNGRSGAKAKKSKNEEAFDDYVAKRGIDTEQPLSQIDDSRMHELLYGNGKKFLGLIQLLEKEYVTTTKKARLEELAAMRGAVTCSACRGSRLRKEAGAVYLADKAIHEITGLSVAEAERFFAKLKFTGSKRKIAKPLLAEIRRRLEFLCQVGVDYLTLDRSADTLSGGELQRVRLATGLGSGLVGVSYVLDEPTIGLHPRDNQRLIDALRDLQQQGNSVLVVEHDEAMMRHADLLIDIGPGAGSAGGEVVAYGSIDEVSSREDSPTGRYLSGRAGSVRGEGRRKVAKSRSITLEGATANNLRDLSVGFPLGTLTCVTGVSGSGKSSLIHETLAPALSRRLTGAGPKPGAHTSLRGVSQIEKVVEIDQTPIGRTPRSNAATYTGAFDEIRKVFAGTKQAKQLGFRATRFSFNVKSGRCEECQGQGVKKIEMNFLPDLFVPCNQCHGARFNRQTLSIKYRGHSIAEVLDLPIDDAVRFFENFSSIHRTLQSLQDVGLGYLSLGQPSTTLSGGEAQRVKLATQLARVDSGKTLYLLDEPTTGLHFDDVRRLLRVLNRLVDKGNTVLVVEHNLEVMQSADWIIDLGPEGGQGGGQLVAAGTPEEVAQAADSHTGRYLSECFAANQSA